MTTLRWEPDPEGIEPEDLIAASGKCVIGGVRRSRSGRYRWEIAMLPGNSTYRDDRSGWLETETEAKAKVQQLWNDWLLKAGLTP